MSKLTVKRQAFVDEYLVDLNAAQAARRAGYSPKNANRIGHELLTMPEVAAAVEAAKAARAERVQIDADYVLRQAQKIHERCMQEVKPLLNKRGEAITDDDGRPLYVFDASNAVKSLELIGKHIGVQAFTERTENVNLNYTISDEPLTDDEWAAEHATH
jgi:phage terminase small subunit